MRKRLWIHAALCVVKHIKSGSVSREPERSKQVYKLCLVSTQRKKIRGHPGRGIKHYMGSETNYTWQLLTGALYLATTYEFNQHCEGLLVETSVEEG